MATTTNLSIKRGNTYRRLLTIYQPDDTVYDLDEATVWFTIKERGDKANDDDDALVKLYWVDGGASSGITVADPDLGVITVELTPAQTNALAVGEPYRYDVQVVKAGKVDTPVEGMLTVTQDTTRRTTTP